MLKALLGLHEKLFCVKFGQLPLEYWAKLSDLHHMNFKLHVQIPLLSNHWQAFLTARSSVTSELTLTMKLHDVTSQQRVTLLSRRWGLPDCFSFLERPSSSSVSVYLFS